MTHSFGKEKRDRGKISRSLKFYLRIVIIALCLSGFLYFCNKELIFKKRLPKVSDSDSKSHTPFLSKKADYSAFLQQIANKNIFAVAYATEVIDASGIDMKKVKKVINGLRLVGIMVDQPKKVMIESKQAQKTFYLAEGEKFLEGIVVEKIEKSSVVLDAYGQKFDLYL